MIALQNGIIVDKEDPIMIMYTVNKKLMQDSAASQQLQLQQFGEELEDLIHRFGLESKDKANQILNAALDASKESMENELSEGTQSAMTDISKEINSIINRASAQSKGSMKVATLNIIASIITMLSAGVVLGLVVGAFNR